MKIPAKYKEYTWLVDTIRRAGRITFAEIQRKWLDSELSEGVELARSTFARHKDAILDIFGIIIDCDRQDGYKYYIGNSEVLDEDSVQNWMLSTISVNNIISESLPLQDRILLEPVPAENNYLELILDAMKKSVRIAIDYRKYGTSTPKHLEFDPYCIKLFKQRWYVLGHFFREATEEKPVSEYYGVFSFDRILNLTVTDVKFQIDPDFSAQTYFSDVWGVLVNDDTQMERIVIRAYGYERYYMRDLPLHKSQREIGHGENFADFELMMRPTVDFSGKLQSRGNNLKVLSPEWLAQELHDMHLDAARMYEEEEN